MNNAHPSHVSRTLTAAGFDRAEQESTAIRGWYRYSPGFGVERAPDGSCVVWHDTMDSSPDKITDTDARERSRWGALADYSETLTRAGYAVALVESAPSHPRRAWLVVAR